MIISRRLALLAALICVSTRPALAADNELSPQEKKAGWKLLFNGKDHTGWKCNNGKKIAAGIEDGALVPWRSGGYIIIHEKQYGDFIFKCDVKMSEPNCNSGIFFRVSDPKNPVQTGYEMQVMNGKGTGYHDFGAIYDLAKPTKNNLTNRQADGDKWQHVEIKCQGPHITISVNGEQVTTMNCDDFTKPGKRPDGSKHKFSRAIKDFARTGYLGFQDHGQKCWYKNVKLLELK